MHQREVAVLQHERSEPGGLFEEFAGAMGTGIVRVPIYETNEIPLIDSTHLLLMGGPMSVNDEKELPWLKREKQVIREWVTKGRPVLGICLGAQLIASSFGGAVYPCKQELGWSPVTSVMEGMVPGMPQTFQVFQMHGETFEIPCGGAMVYRGQKVRHQGLCIGSALGLQFHLEITLDMIQDWISDRPAQEQSALLTESRQYLPESRATCRTLAGRFLSAPSSTFSWIQ
jgi:GMP synthase (glutamine-hydrolysing)